MCTAHGRVIFENRYVKIREKLTTRGSDLTLNQAIDKAYLYELSTAQMKTMSQDPNVNPKDSVTSSEVNP